MLPLSSPTKSSRAVPLSDMPWERFILDHNHNDNDAAGTINSPSLGGVTAMDIACDALAYWRRADPWTDLAHFGAPGPAPLKPSPRARAVVLHRVVVAKAPKCLQDFEEVAFDV
ncbi:hypothetical protein DFJ73DRAFT_774639 [Zopfochytrium polystomum]|nr:hypothetical protein DFJ73DRAFT_774639 [Zopfochytrium polystomum]